MVIRGGGINKSIEKRGGRLMLSEGLIMVSREKQESYRRVETSRSVKVWSSFRIIIPGIPEDLFLSWSGLE